MTSVGSQLLLDWGEFRVYVVDHPQGEFHNLASRFWKIQVLKALAPLFGEQVPLLGVTVVEELGVDALLVCSTLLDQGLPRPHKGPKLLDVRRWDPRLGQPPDQEQLPQVLGIEAIGLGPLLAASERHGVRRLGQVRLASRSQEFFDHEAPARGGLQRESRSLAAEPR